MKNPHSRTKLTSLLAATCLALAPAALAVSPPPDGGYANFNTAEGEDALFSLTTDGMFNTAVGFHALYNTAVGDYNTGTGTNVLYWNTYGGSNTGTGYQALGENTSGSGNTATGSDSLLFNTVGNFNTANGSSTLYFNTRGDRNTACGNDALFSNTTGSNNTADGSGALGSNRTGSTNIALGNNAGFNLTTGSNNIYIGNAGGGGHESAKIRIGTTGTQTATFIAGISGVTVPAGVGVIVGTDGKLGTVVSSERFKDAISRWTRPAKPSSR